MTVFIVDDSRIMRNLVKNYFTDLDFGRCEFMEADNGEDAFRLVQNRPVDLVFLDWNMPKMSGIDFLKQVRKIDAFKHLPIIMVTSEISKNNVIEALKNGATDYIIKPIDEKIFKEKILKVLKK
ncbi:MAG: response regulator [Spirochaetaceae bacterium]|nr:response regulator [Spirochaetaceae bacterium]